MSVLKYLDCTTAHVTEREMETILDRFAVVDDSSPRVIVHEYGAWVNVSHDPDVDSIAGIRDQYPNFARVYDYARERECVWINFDQDAPTESDLPTFDW